MSDRRLEGRVVVLTGGAGLLGRNHCVALARAGARVVVADIDGARAREVAGMLPSGQGMAIAADVTLPSSVEQMVARVVDEFGAIDALVNNAALDPKFDREHSGRHTESFEHYSLEEFRRTIEVNLTGAFICTQAVAPFLLASGRGCIVNVASIYGVVGPDQRLYRRDDHVQYKPVAYSVSKSALLGFTRYLAVYWAGRGIRVNTLTLGGVNAGHDPDFVRRYSDRTPLGRMANADEYSAALVFLLSDDSSYMTGANLVIDGGWTAW